MAPPPRSRRPRRPPGARMPFTSVVLSLLLATAAVLALREDVFGGGGEASRASATSPAPHASGGEGSTPSQTSGAENSPSPSPSQVATPDPINTGFPGLTTFRGNASRSYYGEGPLPQDPVILWQYPREGGLCSESTGIDGTKLWCGTGWTGQPNVIERKDGTIEVRIGAYDSHYHFLNGRTGVPLRPDLVTGDLAKGSATSDPEGYPLYYAGSRDNLFRVVALDRKEPTVLWTIDADTSVSNPVWNNDWDGAALVVGDYLLEGGENSWFYAVKLNRHYDGRGLVEVDPEYVMRVPGWDQQLISDLGDDSVSIENSPAYHDGVVYFGNSGGLVQGWDISNLLHGGTKYERVFRYWVGDETDATIVIDDEGNLYVGRHYSFNIQSRSRTRADEVGGSLIKLDPHRPKDPLLWTVEMGGTGPDGGLLGTPALYDGVVYAEGTDGEVVAVNAATGKVYWRITLAPPLNGSPVTIDDQLLVGDCAGVLHDFDISKPRRKPTELWNVKLSGCIESTPAVWKGMIWVGARGGRFYGIGDRSPA